MGLKIEFRHMHILLVLFFAVLVARIALHQSPLFAGGLTGHLTGIVGTLLMVMTLQYPFKKRIMGRRGKANPLITHIMYGLLGPSLVVVHSANTIRSLVGILCFSAMLFVVLSGIVGMFLFQRVNRTVKEQTRDLNTLQGFFENRRKDIAACRVYLGLEPDHAPQNSVDKSSWDNGTYQVVEDRCNEIVSLAHSIAETEYYISIFSKTKTLLSKWIYAHYIISLFLFSMITVHVMTGYYYGLRWV